MLMLSESVSVIHLVNMKKCDEIVFRILGIFVDIWRYFIVFAYLY